MTPVQFAQVPESERSILASRQDLIRHVRVVVDVASAEEVRVLLLERALPRSSEIPRLQVHVVYSTHLPWVMGVEASSVAALADLHGGALLEARGTQDALEEVKALQVRDHQVAFVVWIPK